MTDVSSLIKIELRGAVSWIIIARPEKSNALNVPMQTIIVAQLQAAAADPEIKAVVLSGAGERVFCSGVDVSEVRSEPPETSARIRSHQMFDTCLAMIDCPKPVIAALNGHAVGAGCILALLADARVAVAESSLSLPEISLGAPTFAGIAVVSRALGDLAAADLVQSGRRMGAAEAASRHLLEVCARDDLAGRAQALAATLTQHSALAYRMNKEWLYRDLRATLERAREESDRVRAAVAAERAQNKAVTALDSR